MVNSCDIKMIAKLADVGVDERELNEFTTHCSEILTYYEMLDALPEGAEIDRGLVNIFRKDVITPSLSQDEALSNAAETETGYFKAPRVK